MNKGELVRDLPLTVAQLPIFSKAYYAAAFRRDDARCAARLWPVSGRQDRARAQHRVRPQAGLLGEGPSCQSRALEFRQDPLRILPRPQPAWRRLRPARTFPRGVHLQRLGDGIRLSRGPRRPRQAGGAAGRDAVGHARVLPQYAARPAERPARAQGARPAFDFEWTNRNIFYGLYDRTQSFFENSPMKAEGEPSEAERALLEVSGCRSLRRLSGPLISRPRATATGQDRKLLQQAAQAARRRRAGRSRRRARER